MVGKSDEGEGEAKTGFWLLPLSCIKRRRSYKQGGKRLLLAVCARVTLLLGSAIKNRIENERREVHRGKLCFCFGYYTHLGLLFL